LYFTRVTVRIRPLQIEEDDVNNSTNRDNGADGELRDP